MLTQDLISDTSHFKLLLRVGSDGAHAVVYAPGADGSLITSALAYSDSDEKKALQDAVYDNPLLLKDFADTIIVVEPRFVTPLPDVLSEEVRRECVAALCPVKGDDLIDDPTGLAGSVFTAAVSHETLTFLKRTFPTARITTHLGSLTRYFASRSVGGGNSASMFVSFRQGALDMVAISDRKLLMANTFKFSSKEDAAYYILACRRQLGLDSVASDLFLTGQRSLRDSVAPELRRFVDRVMPLIFPPELFKAGKDSLLVPFDLMISPLS